MKIAQQKSFSTYSTLLQNTQYHGVWNTVFSAAFCYALWPELPIFVQKLMKYFLSRNNLYALKFGVQVEVLFLLNIIITIGASRILTINFNHQTYLYFSCLVKSPELCKKCLKSLFAMPTIQGVPPRVPHLYGLN